MNCRDCKHYRETEVFDLCMRAESTYSVAGKTDQHTIGHMRDLRGACSTDAKLFERRA